MNVDGATFLKFKPHAPVLHFLDAALLKRVAVLEEESPEDGLQRIVEVQDEQQLQGAQVFVALRKEDSFVERKLPLRRGEGEKELREPRRLPAHIFQ